MSLYIDINQLPMPEEEAVSWIDIMGTKNIFKKADRSPTLYILKLQKCVRQVIGNKTDFRIYPAVDGLFITHNDPNELIKIIIRIFKNIANEFINTNEPGYKFMIRSGVSFGNLTHGDKINHITDTDISESTMKNLLFGKAVIEAAEAEKGKPPFSINIHENSAGIYDQHTSVNVDDDGYVRWFQDNDFDIDLFKNNVREYYSWRDANPHWVNYSPNKKEQHLSAFNDMINNNE